jgi:hypothetical protein
MWLGESKRSTNTLESTLKQFFAVFVMVRIVTLVPINSIENNCREIPWTEFEKSAIYAGATHIRSLARDTI